MRKKRTSMSDARGLNDGRRDRERSSERPVVAG
jgi:hypothetical protein